MYARHCGRVPIDVATQNDYGGHWSSLHIRIVLCFEVCELPAHSCVTGLLSQLELKFRACNVY